MTFVRISAASERFQWLFRLKPRHDMASPTPSASFLIRNLNPWKDLSFPLLESRKRCKEPLMIKMLQWFSISIFALSPLTMAADPAEVTFSNAPAQVDRFD